MAATKRKAAPSGATKRTTKSAKRKTTTKTRKGS